MMQMLGFIIDCPDPLLLAAFYSGVTGGPVADGSSESMALINFADVDLTFQRVKNYRAPQWPDGEHPKQFHIDFEVDDIEVEQGRVLVLGATLQQNSIGPDGYGWRVDTDPAGHPFCLCCHEGVSRVGGRVAWPSH